MVRNINAATEDLRDNKGGPAKRAGAAVQRESEKQG